MNLNLRHLEAFAAVARVRSFTKAARSLHVSQPSFTVQIKQLEEELGVRLLDRNTRSISLTKIGQELAPVVDRLLRELEGIVANTRALSAKSLGSVAIAALPSVSATLLPSVIAGFRQRYSGIGFRLHDAVGKRIVDLTLTHEVDFGIGCIEEGHGEVTFAPLFTDWMSAVFPAAHRFRRKKSIQVSELLSEALILTDRDSTVRHIVDSAFAALGQAVMPVQEVTYMSTAIGMVKAGLGVAILPVLSSANGPVTLSQGHPDRSRSVASDSWCDSQTTPQPFARRRCLPRYASRLSKPPRSYPAVRVQAGSS